jgi:hypothetical protein
MRQITPEQYERMIATVSYGAIRISVERAYPELTEKRQSEIMIAVIDRMARLHGRFGVRCESCEDGDSE